MKKKLTAIILILVVVIGSVAVGILLGRSSNKTDIKNNSEKRIAKDNKANKVSEARSLSIANSKSRKSESEKIVSAKNSVSSSGITEDSMQNMALNWLINKSGNKNLKLPIDSSSVQASFNSDGLYSVPVYDTDTHFIEVDVNPDTCEISSPYGSYSDSNSNGATDTPTVNFPTSDENGQPVAN